MTLEDVKGVGAKTREKLNSLGIYEVSDLVNYLPSHYIDLSSSDHIKDVEIGSYALLKVVITCVGAIVRKKKNIQFFKATGVSDDEKIDFIWFNQTYYHEKLIVGDEFVIWGKLERSTYGGYEMINPNFERADDVKKLKGILPIYRTKGYIPQTTFHNIIKNAISNYEVDSFVDGLTERKFHLPSIQQVFKNIHTPNNMTEAVIAQDRLAIEDCIDKILAFKKLKASNEHIKHTKFMLDTDIIEDIIAKLPFELSMSQATAIEEILRDLTSNEHMNRILLGDVGSGKTIVAFVTMFYAVKCGLQCAMMAPTEILSCQHYNGAVDLFSRLGIRVELLNSSTKSAKRKDIISRLLNHEIDILIGTHSLLNDNIEFANLGYVVIDELHKFGVKQKGKLEDKMQEIDSLVMSATPIPRSVALMYYGDLSMSKLDKRYGTDTIKTYLLGDNKLNGMYNYILNNVKKGKQAYIVCPLVEDDEGNETYSAKQLHKELTTGIFSSIRVGLLYGKMKEDDKTRIMESFRDGKIDVLIATTVIEVGIDVKNANMMLIMNANRFGLATLHQLRGRIGRDGNTAECFLHSGNNASQDRLNIMKDFNDGYDIAEADLDKRGCGDYLGTSQSGGNKFTFMINKRIISLSKTIVDELLTKKSINEFSSERLDRLIAELTNITIN